MVHGLCREKLCRPCLERPARIYVVALLMLGRESRDTQKAAGAVYSAYHQTIPSDYTDFHARFLSQIVGCRDVARCCHSRRIEDEVAIPERGTKMCWTKKKSLLWEEK